MPFGVPNVTLREVTERPGDARMRLEHPLGHRPRRDSFRRVRLVTEPSTAVAARLEYLAPLVAETVLRILTGFRPPDAAELEWHDRTRN